MAKKPTANQIIKGAQAREDKNRARRISDLRLMLAQGSFFDYELSDLEEIAFRAFGRTKLGR